MLDLTNIYKYNYLEPPPPDDSLLLDSDSDGDPELDDGGDTLLEDDSALIQEWADYDAALADYNSKYSSYGCSSLQKPTYPTLQELIKSPIDACDEAANKKASDYNALVLNRYNSLLSTYNYNKSRCDALVPPIPPSESRPFTGFSNFRNMNTQIGAFHYPTYQAHKKPAQFSNVIGVAIPYAIGLAAGKIFGSNDQRWLPYGWSFKRTEEKLRVAERELAEASADYEKWTEKLEGMISNQLFYDYRKKRQLKAADKVLFWQEWIPRLTESNEEPGGGNGVTLPNFPDNGNTGNNNNTGDNGNNYPDLPAPPISTGGISSNNALVYGGIALMGVALIIVLVKR